LALDACAEISSLFRGALLPQSALMPFETHKMEIINWSEAGVMIKYSRELKNRLKIFRFGNSPQIEIVIVPRTSTTITQRPKFSDWIKDKVMIKQHRFKITMKGITVYSRRGLYCEMKENLAKLSTLSPDESHSFQKSKIF
jgi:hypothetical protein